MTESSSGYEREIASAITYSRLCNERYWCAGFGFKHTVARFCASAGRRACQPCVGFRLACQDSFGDYPDWQERHRAVFISGRDV